MANFTLAIRGFSMLSREEMDSVRSHKLGPIPLAWGGGETLGKLLRFLFVFRKLLPLGRKVWGLPDCLGFHDSILQPVSSHFPLFWWKSRKGARCRE